MKIAIYCRVSDDKKKSDGERRQDVQRQVNILREQANLSGDTEILEYIDDGKSAWTEDLNSRPSFKQMLNDCRRNFIKKVYIEDMTRFSRNLSLGLQWLRELGELNVHLVSLKEGEIDVTASRSWLQSTMLLMFAEWDSRIKSEKVKTGMLKAKSLGKKVGGFRKTPLDTSKSELNEQLVRASLKR